MHHRNIMCSQIAVSRGPSCVNKNGHCTAITDSLCISPGNCPNKTKSKSNFAGPNETQSFLLTVELCSDDSQITLEPFCIPVFDK